MCGHVVSVMRDPLQATAAPIPLENDDRVLVSGVSGSEASHRSWSLSGRSRV